jgi:cell division protein FtsL
MKKGSKSNIAISLFYCVVVAFFMLAYVGLRLKCEQLIKDKVDKQYTLKKTNDMNLSLIAQQQDLSSEERITGIAQNELGMIKDNGQKQTITVDTEEIDKISEALKEKYE